MAPDEIKGEAREEALSIGIGRRVRENRKKRGMTLAQLGELSGLSVGLLSQVENDGVVPPIPTLLSIAKALGLKIESFFKDEDKSSISVERKKDHEPERHRRPQGVGYHYLSLAGKRANKKMDPFIVEFEPRPKEDLKFFNHEGEEFIYVLDGILEFASNNESHILEAGDSIYFDSNRSHGVRGVDAKTSKAIIIVTG